MVISGPDLAGGRPGAQPGHNFGLKSGGPNLRHLRRRDEELEGHPSQPTRGTGAVVKLYHNLRGGVKYGER